MGAPGITGIPRTGNKQGEEVTHEVYTIRANHCVKLLLQRYIIRGSCLLPRSLRAKFNGCGRENSYNQ